MLALDFTTDDTAGFKSHLDQAAYGSGATAGRPIAWLQSIPAGWTTLPHRSCDPHLAFLRTEPRAGADRPSRKSRRGPHTAEFMQPQAHRRE
jgi:hypothetical protein